MQSSNKLTNYSEYFAQYGTPKAKPSLSEVLAVAKKLTIDKVDLPVITVAGTNGKGSTVTVIESILIQAGYRVACFTSPWLVQFNEQFRVNQAYIDYQILIDCFVKIDQARGSIPLTFFEFKFLAALLSFKQYPLDVLVLEVGLGGEFDAVNIIDPTIAVITSIGMDHMDRLGNSLAEIAAAKAGIFRANQRAVYGAPTPPSTILAKAQQLGTQVYYYQQDFTYEITGDSWCFTNLVTQSSFTKLPIPTLLVNNAATAVMALELLAQVSPLSIAIEAYRLGLTHAFIPGRQQILQYHPLVILDVAHNVESVLALKTFLQNQIQLPGQDKKIIAVFSILKQKKLLDILRVIADLIDSWHIAELEDNRSQTVPVISEAIQQISPAASIHAYDSIALAYQTALASVTDQECVLAFGSFSVVSAISA